MITMTLIRCNFNQIIIPLSVCILFPLMTKKAFYCNFIVIYYLSKPTKQQYLIADAVAGEEGIYRGVAATEAAIEFSRVFRASAHEDFRAE